MLRMRRYFVTFGLTVAAIGASGRSAQAGLLRPDAGRAYPDVLAGAVNGTQTYTFDSASQLGRYEVKSTPTQIAGGAVDAEVFDIDANADGSRSQTIIATIDGTGKLVSAGENSYELHGSVVADGQTFNGLLLKGTPTGFGSKDLGTDVGGADVYDMNISVDGGSLAPYFGPDAYVRINTEIASTFDGTFTANFSGEKTSTNTRGYNSPKPFPVPEPSTLVLIVASAAGLLYRNRRRITTADLGA